ncbi:hypothetical protein MRX96_046517 [Rhipicephalus microplus]
MRKQKDLLYLQATSPERHDPVTRRALSLEEEEEIRNSETNRWLDNHFGSETSDDDAVKSKHGGNVINSPTPSPTPLDSTLRSTKSQQKTTSYRREEKVDDSRQSRSSPRSNWKSSPSIYHDVTRHLDESPTRYTKEDRSYRDLESSYRPVEKSTIVGNSVFTREDRRLNESKRVTSEYDRDIKRQPPQERPRSPESRPVQRSQSTRTPEKPVAQTPNYTYSLPRGSTSRRATRVDQASKTSRGVQADLDDEPYTPPQLALRRAHKTEHHRRSGDRNRSPDSNISTASRPSKTFYFGDKTDTSYHDSRHKDGYFTIEKDRYVKPPRRFRSDPRERYYSVEDLTTRSYATPTSSPKKPSFIDRQRYFPATPPASPPPRLIKITNGRSTSPSPPESPKPTSTSHLLPPPSPYASLNRRYRSPSPVVNPPAFTPLQSPVEVKRQQSTSSYNRSYHHRSATADSTGSKPGPSVIEVRNWDSR